MRKSICIRSLRQLTKIAENNTVSCFVLLSGVFRSSKDISYHRPTDMWSIYNYIDDTEQDLRTHELETETNIIEAIDHGALWYDSVVGQ